MIYNDDGTKKYDMEEQDNPYLLKSNAKWIQGLVDNKECIEDIRNREWNQLSQLERTVYIKWSLREEDRKNQMRCVKYGLTTEQLLKLHRGWEEQQRLENLLNHKEKV